MNTEQRCVFAAQQNTKSTVKVTSNTMQRKSESNRKPSVNQIKNGFENIFEYNFFLFCSFVSSLYFIIINFQVWLCETIVRSRSRTHQSLCWKCCADSRVPFSSTDIVSVLSICLHFALQLDAASWVFLRPLGSIVKMVRFGFFVVEIIWCSLETVHNRVFSHCATHMSRTCLKLVFQRN